MYLIVVRIWQSAVRLGICTLRHPQTLGRCHGEGPAGPGEVSLISQDSKALSGAQQGLWIQRDRQYPKLYY